MNIESSKSSGESLSLLSSSSLSSSEESSSSASGGCSCIQLRFVPLGASRQICVEVYPSEDGNFYLDDIEIVKAPVGSDPQDYWVVEIGGETLSPKEDPLEDQTGECPFFGTYTDPTLGDVELGPCDGCSSSSPSTLSSKISIDSSLDSDDPIIMDSPLDEFGEDDSTEDPFV